MASTPSRRRCRRTRTGDASEVGFTLIEMMVALAIITGVVLALLSGFITSAASLQSQQERARASRVALDLHEKLRLLAYEDLDAVPATQSIAAPGGLNVTVTTEVRDRASTSDTSIAGRLVKELVTTARWTGRGGLERSIVYTTAIAQDARSVGGSGGYEKAIKSMSISPDPSASVDYFGHTSVPVDITITMTGHDVSDTVAVRWSDDAGSGRSTIATSTEGRIWRARIPAGSGGIKLLLGPNQRKDLEFVATTATSLSTRSSLAVWGPVENPPLITSFTVSPNPIRLFNGGGSRLQNRDDVVVTCQVDKLDTSSTSKDSVKLKYTGENGALLEQALTRTAVSGSVATYSYTFVKSSHYFSRNVTTPWTCAVSRFSDGGPASKSINVSTA